MAENNQDESSSHFYISLPEIYFDKTWANIPDNMKKSLIANPSVCVMYINGKTVPLGVYLTIKKDKNNVTS